MALTREAGKNGKLAALLAEAGISSVEVRWEMGGAQEGEGNDRKRTAAHYKQQRILLIDSPSATLRL